MAYAVAADIATELGTTFSGGQTTQATDLIASAQDWIDHYLHRTFEASTPITDELHVIYGPVVYLDRAPIASVSSVKVRPAYVGATLTTLVADTDYSMVSLTQGQLRLAYLYSDQAELLVSYTPAITVPARIKRATVLLVASWMAPGVSGVPSGVKRYSVGGELTVEFGDGSSGDVPSEVLRLLGAPRLVFA